MHVFLTHACAQRLIGDIWGFNQEVLARM